MKKILTVTFVMALCLTVSNVWAQPYTPNIAGDVYGAAQGGTNLPNVPTPNDDNDNLFLDDAETIPNPNPADINDAINLLLNGSYAHNSDVDFLQYLLPDYTWEDLSQENFEGTYVMIGLTAGNSNTLGVYDVNDAATHIPVLGPFSGFGFMGDGTFGNPFPASVSPFEAGTNFGWYLDSASLTWNSNPNLDDNAGYDHMLTYHLSQLANKKVYIGYDCTGEPGEVVCEDVQEYTFYDPYLIVWEDLPLNGSVLGDEDYDDMMFLVDRVRPIPEPISMVLFGTGLAGLVALRRKRG